MKKSQCGMLVLAVSVLLVACGKEPKVEVDANAAPASVQKSGLCNKETLEHCTDEQKALIRMSGSGLKK